MKKKMDWISFGYGVAFMGFIGIVAVLVGQLMQRGIY